MFICDEIKMVSALVFLFRAPEAESPAASQVVSSQAKRRVLRQRPEAMRPVSPMRLAESLVVQVAD